MTDSFTDVFSGSPVSPAQVGYAAYSFSADLVLFWPQFNFNQPDVVAQFMNMTATTSGRQIFLPDATLVSTGTSTIIFNQGSNSFNVVDENGGAIITVAAGEAYYILLKTNTTTAGTWQTVKFGAGTSNANAAALAGAGLLAIGSLLNTNFPVTTVSNSYTITTANRAILQTWTGGAGTITLPAAFSVGAGFFFPFNNSGSGSVVIATSGGEHIDGATTSTFAQMQSGFIISSGTGWYTVGKGVPANSTVTLLNLNVAGNSDITETSAQAQNTIQQFTGALTGDINIIVPATVQLFYAFNGTSGAHTLTMKTAAGTGQTIPQGTHAILYCDGTNVVNAYTSSISSTISISAGSANSPNFNFVGSASTGVYSPAANQIAVTAGGFEVMNFISAASSVNFFQTAASATGVALSLTALGTDTNIGINYVAKGTGSHNFLANGGATQFVIGNVTSAVNQFTMAGSATGNALILAATGSDTNIGVNYTAKGSGVHTFNNTVNGTFVGNITGNVTGDISGNAATVTTINGRITAGSNVTVTGSGTAGSPYSIAAAAGFTSLVNDVTGSGSGAVATTVAAIQGKTVSGTTGTVNVVFSASPTFTGTITAAAVNLSGALASNVHTITATSAGATQNMILATNASSSTNTGASIQLNPASATTRYGSIEVINDGTDALTMNFKLSNTGAPATVFSIGPTGGINVFGASGVVNSGDINIPSGSSFKIGGTAINATDRQTFNSSGTWTKPANYASSALALIECWGGGGGGGTNHSTSNQAGGGGGGSYAYIILPLSALSATETVTVGAAGTGSTAGGGATADGGNGGASSLGSRLTAYGGTGGQGNGIGGAGGGIFATASLGSTNNDTTILGSPGIVGGNGTSGTYYTGGGGASGVANSGGTSLFAGGGGGAGVGAGGASQQAGNGGAGSTTTIASAGAQPGGGGGGTGNSNNSAAGAAGGAGRVRVTVFY